MLVQLFRDNYTTTPTEYLISTIYTGFFDGIEGWFDTAPVVATDLRTSDLTDLTTISKNLFYSTDERSIKVTGFFRAKKTGTYRFFTSSNDKNILEIDGDDVIVNTDVFQTLYANKSLIEGRYYPFNLYYGSRVFNYPPALLSDTLNTTTLAGQLYGNGVYNVTFSSQNNNTDRAARNLFDAAVGGDGIWRPATVLDSWVQLELPNAIVLGSYQVNTSSGPGGGNPTQFKLEGSNDNFATSVLLNTTNWGINQGSLTIQINPPVNQAFRFFRLTNLAAGHFTSFIAYHPPLIFNEQPSLTCGYTEPNEDGTSTGSTNPGDFITDATGLTTYYDINPDTQPTQVTAAFPLLYLDNTLEGLFKVSILALYFNRTNFASTKDNILYLASDELFNNFNGTYKNYIQLHESPIANLVVLPHKRFNQFSSDMSFECELNGKIEVRFRRGTAESVQFRYAMLILDVERLPVKKI